MGRIRAGFALGVVAGTLMLVACSDEPGSRSDASAAKPSDVTASAAASPGSVPAAAEAGGSAASNPPAADTRSPAERIAAGRSTYNANCIACHAMDPRQDGALGPAVAGSSPELLEARVLRAGYPAGYVPKRDTKVMVPLPHLQPKLPELAAYLDSLE